MRRAGAAVLALVVAAPPAAAEPWSLGASAGAFDANKRRDAAAELGVQWRGGEGWWVLRPIAGAMGTTDRAFHAYAGFCFDLSLGRRLVLRPSFAPGYYARGDGKDLGHPLQFRSGIEVGWRFGDGLRLGLELYHLSNSSLADRNPGEETLALTLSVPARRLFGR